MATIPAVRIEEWIGRAACRDVDPAERERIFFPPPGDSQEPAKRICRTCPVQVACLEHALRNHEEHGIWGGTSGKERVRIARARRRQRLTAAS